MDKEKKLLLRPREAFELISVGRSTGYALLASGEIPSVRIGRSVRVSVEALQKWIERQTSKGDSC